MTPYRDRLEAGEYAPKKPEKASAKKAAATKKSGAKK